MRKILLTTTALVAVGGVSAASALDISGSYTFDYNDTSDTNVSGATASQNTNVSGTQFGSDAAIDFSGSTTADNGLTFGGLIRIATDQTNDNTATQTVAVEDQGIYVSGDFGYVMMGATDGVVDGMDNFMTSGSIVENGVATSSDANMNLSSNVADNEAVGKVGYRSNNIQGFQFGVSMEDGGDNGSENDDLASWIVTYDVMGLATIGYAQAKDPSASSDGADTKMTQYGIRTSFAGATIQLGMGSESTAGAGGQADTTKVDTRDFAVQYSLNDQAGVYFVDVISEEKAGTNIGDKLTGNTLGLSYTITPGVSALIEHNNADFKDASVVNTESRKNTYVGLSVTF
jgi:hypothetical protein